jgi:prepilin-type N-terminal cleavage/methylation domain-containing protein
MARAFSIVELLIVAAIIGILAAIVLPTISGQTMEAKEAAARDNLRILRSAIELYAAQHRGVAPGYAGDDPQAGASEATFRQQMVTDDGYLRSLPENPFNGLDTIYVIGNSESLPPAATGTYGWIYKPSVQTIRLDWPGSTPDGVPYYDL